MLATTKTGLINIFSNLIFSCSDLVNDYVISIPGPGLAQVICCTLVSSDENNKDFMTGWLLTLLLTLDLEFYHDNTLAGLHQFVFTEFYPGSSRLRISNRNPLVFGRLVCNLCLLE